MAEAGSITIELSEIREGLCLFIDERKPESLFEIEDSGKKNNVSD